MDLCTFKAQQDKWKLVLYLGVRALVPENLGEVVSLRVL